MKILITTSTLPSSDTDNAPAFVKDQAIALKKAYPLVDIIIHAPYSAHGNGVVANNANIDYEEVRFHYFWPFRWELLTGRGIMPALKNNRLLYAQIPFLFIFQFLSLLRLAQKEKPSIIYAHWFTPQAISSAIVAKITKIPLVFTTHASDVAVLKKVPLSKKLVRWVCKSSRSYTAVSRRTADKLMHFFDEEEWNDTFLKKLKILPMGTRLDRTAVNKAALIRLKTDLNLPDDKEFILFIGRLVEKKGVKYLIKAFADLPLELSKNLHLIIAGDGHLKSSLQEEAHKLGLSNITFTGYVHGETKDALFAISNYTCFPSIIDSQGDSEGFPVAIMESLGAGKIVIASNTTGAEDFITNGEDGYVFPEHSSSELKKALVAAVGLSQEEKSSMEREARNLGNLFDINLIIKEYAKVLGLHD